MTYFVQQPHWTADIEFRLPNSVRQLTFPGSVQLENDFEVAGSTRLGAIVQQGGGEWIVSSVHVDKLERFSSQAAAFEHLGRAVQEAIEVELLEGDHVPFGWGFSQRPVSK
jgi:hypothetical protein